jgi:hypothetical protein
MPLKFHDVQTTFSLNRSWSKHCCDPHQKLLHQPSSQPILTSDIIGQRYYQR